MSDAREQRSLDESVDATDNCDSHIPSRAQRSIVTNQVDVHSEGLTRNMRYAWQSVRVFEKLKTPPWVLVHGMMLRSLRLAWAGTPARVIHNNIRRVHAVTASSSGNQLVVRLCVFSSGVPQHTPPTGTNWHVASSPTRIL